MIDNSSLYASHDHNHIYTNLEHHLSIFKYYSSEFPIIYKILKRLINYSIRLARLPEPWGYDGTILELSLYDNQINSASYSFFKIVKSFAFDLHVLGKLVPSDNLNNCAKLS